MSSLTTCGAALLQQGGQLEVLSDCKPIIHSCHNCCRPPSTVSFFCLPAAGHHQNFV